MPRLRAEDLLLGRDPYCECGTRLPPGERLLIEGEWLCHRCYWLRTFEISLDDVDVQRIRGRSSVVVPRSLVVVGVEAG